MATSQWLDTQAAHAALARVSVNQRAALTLRYLDGLPVVAAAEHLGRTVHATEICPRQLRLRSEGLHFLDDIVSSTGTRQILLEDPSGNPIELFEAIEGYHQRPRTTFTRRNT